VETRDRTLTPALIVVAASGKGKSKAKAPVKREYTLPIRARIQVVDGDEIMAGQVLAKIPRQSAKTRDITGGLPRVIELFEARQPTDPATVSQIDGEISFGKRKRGSQEVIVTSRDGLDERTYLVPLSKYMLVYENDAVRAGDPLSDGQVSPQDILSIQGPFAVQKYLVNEIQEVYRLQGVTINDKHIEIIVRQMMQKVRVTDPGDTRFLEDRLVDRSALESVNDDLYDKFVTIDAGESKLGVGDTVDRRSLRDINSEMKRHDKGQVEVRPTQPAVAEPVLLGITQAALSTGSFISAASFQETTKVLTQAAIEAGRDELYGLKENVIVGHLVPAGTGVKSVREVIVGSRKELEALQAITSTASATSAGGDGEEAKPEVESGA